MKEVRKRIDKNARNSAKSLKNKVKSSITSVFKAALDMIELKCGKDFDGYDDLRAKILRNGNNAIRDLEEHIDESYNIEIIPNIYTVNFNQGKVEKDE